MQLDTGALVNGSCLNASDTYDMVQCPSGSYKLPQSDVAGLCAARGLPCPAVGYAITALPCSLVGHVATALCLQSM